MARQLKSRGDFIWYSSIYVITALAALVCILPVLHVVAISLSSNSAILNSRVSIIPVEATIQSYQQILSDSTMTWSLIFTVLITVLYTAIGMILTVSAAFALTKKRLKGRMIFLVIIVITMYFNGGLIPNYLLMRDLGFIDTIWSLVLPGALSVWNLIILKSFFADLPESFEESAQLDGANDIQILARIVLPLSAPVIATVSLFYAVGRWNGFMDALFYINEPSMYPLQFKLYQIVMQSTALDVSTAEGATTSMLLPEASKAACVVFATVPIILVYPWLQRYFIKGATLGGIKG
jgi:putative aldouronate transport system permease protein